MTVAPAAGTPACREGPGLVFVWIQKLCSQWTSRWWGWQAGLKCRLGAGSGCPVHRNSPWESLQTGQMTHMNNSSSKKKKKKKKPFPSVTPTNNSLDTQTLSLLPRVHGHHVYIISIFITLTSTTPVSFSSRYICTNTTFLFPHVTLSWLSVRQSIHSGHAALQLLCNYHSSNLWTTEARRSANCPLTFGELLQWVFLFVLDDPGHLQLTADSWTKHISISERA